MPGPTVALGESMVAKFDRRGPPPERGGTPAASLPKCSWKRRAGSHWERSRSITGKEVKRCGGGFVGRRSSRGVRRARSAGGSHLATDRTTRAEISHSPISGETGSLTPGDISARGMGQRAYARPQSPALIDHGPMTVGPRRAFITEPQLGLCSRFPWTAHLSTVGSNKLVH